MLEPFKKSGIPSGVLSTRSNNSSEFTQVHMDLAIPGTNRDGVFTLPAAENFATSESNPRDPIHDYSDKNRNGYRSPDFGKVDLITLGCSQTYGIGVCRENIWPELLAKKLDVSHVNLATPGSSLVRSILEFYSYIEFYGKPKSVAVLCPDFYRMYIPRGHPHLKGEGEEGKLPPIKMRNVSIAKYSTHGSTTWDSVMPKVSMRPHRVEDVFSPEISISENFRVLNSFLLFCKYANIAVVIDTWNSELSYILNILDYLSDDVFANCLKANPVKGCKSHGLEEKFIDHNEFHRGTDNPDTNGHMGAHAHIHYAEQFALTLAEQLASK